MFDFFLYFAHHMYMIEKIKGLSELKKMLVLALFVSLILIGCSCIGLAFNQPGWLIGVAIGSSIEVINIILLYKGSGEILKNEKPALFLAFYALRMLLVIGVILGLVLLQYKAKIAAFEYSFWGALIGYTPMQLIVVIVSIRHKDEKKING